MSIYEHHRSHERTDNREQDDAIRQATTKKAIFGKIDAKRRPAQRAMVNATKTEKQVAVQTINVANCSSPNLIQLTTLDCYFLIHHFIIAFKFPPRIA